MGAGRAEVTSYGTHLIAGTVAQITSLGSPVHDIPGVRTVSAFANAQRR